MIEIGRVCLKIAGRDSKCKCVIIDVIDEKTVLIDGETRRRKCNIIHLEPTPAKLNIKKGASRAEIVKEFKKLGIELKEKKSKKPKERPRRGRKARQNEQAVEKKK